MNNKIILKYQLSKKEYIDAIILHHKLQKKRFIISNLIAILIFVVYYFVFKFTMTQVVLIVIIYIIIYWLMKLLLRYKHKKIFESSKLLKSKTEVTFYPDRFSVVTDKSEAILQYSVLLKCHKDSEFLLIYSQKIAFFIVPIEAFKDESELNRVCERLKCLLQ